MLILMNIWMIWKNSMKHHYLKKKKKKIFIVKNLYMEDITDAAYAHAKRVSKDFEIKKFRRISWFVCSKR